LTVQQLRSVLVDIEGVLSTSGVAIPRSIDALAMLRERGVGLRFLTNTTRQTRSSIVRQLNGIGFDIAEHEVVTGSLAARQVIKRRGLRPFLLVHPDLLPEFDGVSHEHPNAVVVGDAAEGFSYEAMNKAMRILLEHPSAPLIAIARNRYFRAAGGIFMDAGPYIAALEYAADVRAEVVGKPSPAIFRTALAELGTAPEQAAMIGDDVESDVGGAQAIGLLGVLVRTGKYRPSDEAATRPRADIVSNDFFSAVVKLLEPTG
jgi:HAD superfamily hydrolase (TIGR01458 family)